MPRIAAMVSKQGTACSETALCEAHDTPVNRLNAEQVTKSYGQDQGLTWEDSVENDALHCNVCGVDFEGQSDDSPEDEAGRPIDV